MNLQYTVPNPGNKSVLWLLFSAAILTTLLYALAAWAPVFQITHNTSNDSILIPAGDQLPQAMRAPAPPQGVPAETTQMSAAPHKTAVQPLPIPQPVPTPPPGK